MDSSHKATGPHFHARVLATALPLLASIVHELDNGFGLLAVRLQQLLESCEVTERSKPVFKSEVNSILDHISAMHTTFRRVRAIVRSQFERDDQLFRDVLADVTDMAELVARRTGVKLVWRCDKQVTDLRVSALVRIVLMNLITNAIQATERGNVFVEIVASSNGILGSVRDSGSGIPKQFEKQIWDAGFSTRHDATGFGLTIAKQATERIGGTLALSANSSRGCTFTFKFPLQ